VDQRSRLAVGGGTPYVLELDRSTPEGYERLKLLGACLTQQAAGSNQALRGTTLGVIVTAVRLDKVPRQSLLVSTTANQNERPLLALASKGPAADVADDSMTPITSVAILSLPQRARAEDAAFSPLALSHRPEPAPRPTAPRGGDQQRMGQW